MFIFFFLGKFLETVLAVKLYGRQECIGNAKFLCMLCIVEQEPVEVIVATIKGDERIVGCKGERVAKLLDWPNFVQAECHWQVLNLPKWLRRRPNSPKARKSVILFTALALFNSLWGMGNLCVYSIVIPFAGIRNENVVSSLTVETTKSPLVMTSMPMSTS